MNFKKIVVIVFFPLALTGCLTHYVYETRTALPYADSQEHAAVIYWGKDEGRLWYGKKIKNGEDSDVAMRVCEKISFLTYVPLEGTNELTLLSAPGDQVAASDNNSGEINLLVVPQAVGIGETCGRIIINNRYAKITDLTPGIKPTLTVLCKNQRNPDRYPAIGAYQFNEILRKEGGGGDAPLPCISSANQ